MTLEEIKESVTMRDVLKRYGVEVTRSGMCSCPLHGKDRHPSMKVFKDGYKCFACNSGGDIFTFVQSMENCSFKDAFILLGGTYEHEDNKALNRLKQAKYKRSREQKQQEKTDETDFRKIIDQGLEDCRFLISNREPFSDPWCFAQNTIEWLTYIWDMKYLEGEEINKLDVYRKCKRLKSYRHS